MRKFLTIGVATTMILLPTIGSSGTGTMLPGASHADRALYLRDGARAPLVDLAAVDVVTLAAIDRRLPVTPALQPAAD